MFKNIFFLALLIFICGCGNVSYPKDNLSDSLEALVLKECGTVVDAVIVGRTIYLDMELDGLTSAEQEKVQEAINKMQSAVMSITRVALSTDADIKYMVVNTFNPGKQIAFVFLQNIEDVKGYLYMRISRSDYESRNLMEIEGPETAEAAIEDKHDISDDEYVGRMIASQIMMSGRTDPDRYALVSKMQLKYFGIHDSVLYFMVLGSIDDKDKNLINGIISGETVKYEKKYGVKFNAVKVINRKGEILADIPL